MKFKEEEVNTKKMSTILKSLNSPKRRTASHFNAVRLNSGGFHQNNSKTDRSNGNGINKQMSQSLYS